MTEEDPIVMEYLLFTKHKEIYEEAVPICMSKPFRVIQDLLEEGVKNKEIRDGRPEILTASFVGIPLKIIELKLRGVINYPLQEVFEDTVNSAWDAVKK